MNRIRGAWFWVVAVASFALITAILVTGVYGGEPGPKLSRVRAVLLI